MPPNIKDRYQTPVYRQGRAFNLKSCALVVAIALGCLSGERALAADDLRLAPSLSFTDDSSSNFPIDGKDLTNGTAATDRATIIFFGTAHCWNTNREAERLVSVYPKYRGKIDFIIVDLDRPSSEQRDLIARYYRGYIPTVAILDSHGHVVYDRAGETASERGDASELESLLNSAH
jgi:hypothetical protein